MSQMKGLNIGNLNIRGTLNKSYFIFHNLGQFEGSCYIQLCILLEIYMPNISKHIQSKYYFGNLPIYACLCENTHLEILGYMQTSISTDIQCEYMFGNHLMYTVQVSKINTPGNMMHTTLVIFVYLIIMFTSIQAKTLLET